MERLVALNIPEKFNAAAFFVDRNVDEGRGSKVAIECGEERITYVQLLENVNRVGNALRRELHVRMEERILLLLLDGPELIYSFFGAIKIGAVPVPLNTLWKPADLEYALNDSRARVLIVGHTLLSAILAIPVDRRPFLDHIIVVGNDRTPGELQRFDQLMSAGINELAAASTSRDDAAFWLYSSGSTGSPKGCVHLHHDMPYCAEAYARGVLAMTAEDRCYSIAKIFFAYGLGNSVYCPFAVGATTILSPDPPAAPTVYSIIERYRPTLFFSVPTNYGMLLAHRREGPDFDLSSIRHAVSAGEALPPALFERFKSRFGIEILDGIGSTEVLHIFISNRPGEIRPGSSGKEIAGYEARLVDDDGQPVPRGEIGNLLISGDSTCAGYWNQHEKTKATIEGRWIRTGDKYSQDEDGFFWYAGRSDDMLKVGGIWVSPIEVENTLLRHPVVLEAAVIGRCDHDELVKPAAYVVLRPPAEPSDDLARNLQQFVGSELAEYKRPRWIEFVAALPRTATGKIQRFKLRALDVTTSEAL
jgi:benzoate-CoA ligase family protein